MPAESGRLIVTEHFVLRKYDGEYREGMVPVETIEITVETDAETGAVLRYQRTNSKENASGSDNRIS